MYKENNTKEQLHEVGVIVGELMYLLPDALIYRNMDQIVMIQQVDSNQTETGVSERDGRSRGCYPAKHPL